jgi:hypothetical protein
MMVAGVNNLVPLPRENESSIFIYPLDAVHKFGYTNGLAKFNCLRINTGTICAINFS